MAERLFARKEAALRKRAFRRIASVPGVAPDRDERLRACHARGDRPLPHAAVEQHYALVVKDVTNPYMQRMFSGFAEACAAIGARAVLAGPEDVSVEGQIACVRSLIQSGVDAIAIAANDRDALSPVLQYALAAGIKVISLDSDVRPEDRLVHIQQASPEVIGRVLMQAAREIAAPRAITPSSLPRPAPPTRRSGSSGCCAKSTKTPISTGE